MLFEESFGADQSVNLILWGFMMKYISTLAFLSIIWTSTVSADSVDAFCEQHPKGQANTEGPAPCTFSQRQGAVSISLQDGTHYDLTPTGDLPGNYLDQSGRPAYRNSGLGTEGLIFTLAEVAIYVYWELPKN